MQIDCKLKLKVKKREMPLYHEVEESDTAEILRYIPTQILWYIQTHTNEDVTELDL